jgi:hypothetical protein
MTLMFFVTVKLVKSRQLAKASLLIFFIFVGISILTNPLRPEKAPTPIVTTTSGITVFLHPKINAFVFLSIIALQL